HEQLEHAARAELTHRQQPPVPAHRGADPTAAASVRRPHRERGARDAVDLAGVGTEHAPELAVTALAEQVQVELSERGREAVGVVALQAAALELEAKAVGR